MTLEELEQKLTEAENRINALEEENKTLKASVDSYEETKKRIDTLEEDSKSLKASSEEQANSVKGTSERVEKLETAYKEIYNSGEKKVVKDEDKEEEKLSLKDKIFNAICK